MRTRPDKKCPGKYSRFVLSKSIKNLLSFLVILPPRRTLFFNYIYLQRLTVRASVYVTAASRSLNAHQGMRKEQSFFSIRYLMMRGENHWLASHQHVRSMWHASLPLVSFFCLSLFLSFTNSFAG